jgi:hypothetical protein
MIVTCPSCGIQLGVPETLMGSMVKCASCGTAFEAGATPSEAGGHLRRPPPSLPSASKRYAETRPFPPDDDDRDDVSTWARGPRRDLLPHRGGTVLTLGIISVSLCPLAFCSLPGLVFGIASLAVGIPALVLGQADLRQMNAQRMDPDGRGTTHAGWICAIIGTCISGLAMVIVLFFVVLWGSQLWHL